MLDAITYAYRRIGIGQGSLFTLIWLSLLGGFVNIPVARLPGRETLGVGEIVVFGVRYRVPVVRRQQATILAVNLGGAVIPTGLSVYLLVKNDVWWQAAIAVAFVAAVVHAIARPVPGLGIAVPALVPPLLAAAAALALSATASAAVAYVSGTLGTLIGADLLNVRRLPTRRRSRVDRWRRHIRRRVPHRDHGCGPCRRFLRTAALPCPRSRVRWWETPVGCVAGCGWRAWGRSRSCAYGVRGSP